MFHPDDPTASGGNYTEGTPGVAVPTRVRADHLNAIKDEIINAIEAYGLTLDKNDSTQLAQALAEIAALVADRLIAPHGITATATDTNGDGLRGTANGNGSGVRGDGASGGGGAGGSFTGGSANGPGVRGNGLGSGDGGEFTGGPSAGDGLTATGGAGGYGARIVGGAGSAAMAITGGSGNTDGIQGGATGNGNSLNLTAAGSGAVALLTHSGSGPAAKLDASGGTGPALRLVSQSAPASPVDGDMWFDGTNLKFRKGGVTVTIV